MKDQLLSIMVTSIEMDVKILLSAINMEPQWLCVILKEERLTGFRTLELLMESGKGII